MSIYKDFVQQILPKGLLDYFELTDFKKSDSKFIVHLKELDTPPEEYKNEHIHLDGFLPESVVKDFPIRGLFVELHLKKRRWFLVNDNKKITRNWELVSSGSRLTKELADFLKEFN